jgi:hypothetical protein
MQKDGIACWFLSCIVVFDFILLDTLAEWQSSTVDVVFFSCDIASDSVILSF